MLRADRISIQHGSRLLQVTRSGNRAIQPPIGSIARFGAAEDSDNQLAKYVMSVTQSLNRESRPHTAMKRRRPARRRRFRPGTGSRPHARGMPPALEPRSAGGRSRDVSWGIGFRKSLIEIKRIAPATQVYPATPSAGVPYDPQHPSYSPSALFSTVRTNGGPQVWKTGWIRAYAAMPRPKTAPASRFANAVNSR